jgi:hypothetical protein
MIYTTLMHRQRSRRGTKIPHNAVIHTLLVKITETELVIQDLQTAIDGDGNGAGHLSTPQHKQASKHLLNRQRKIISQCQQLDKLQSVLRSGKCGLLVWTKSMTSLLLMSWTVTLMQKVVVPDQTSMPVLTFVYTSRGTSASKAILKKQAVRRHLAPFPCIWMVLLHVPSSGSRSRPMVVVKVGRW